jgi:hypothetical protein
VAYNNFHLDVKPAVELIKNLLAKMNYQNWYLDIFQFISHKIIFGFIPLWSHLWC